MSIGTKQVVTGSNTSELYSTDTFLITSETPN